eukprot:2891031-Amphidinium_carterae.1
MEAYIAPLKPARLEWLAEDGVSSISDRGYAAKFAKVEELLRVMHPSVADLGRRAGRALPAAPSYRRLGPASTYTRPQQ